MTWLPFASLGISLAALAASAIAMWKTHFAAFRPVTTVGALTLRCYPIRYEPETWYIMSFGVPFSVLNAGAQPGVIQQVRLTLRYQDLPIPGNYEHVDGRFEIDPSKAAQLGPDRRRWLEKLVVGDPMPFPILPKATVMRYVLFETRWDAPVVQANVMAELQFRINDKWRGVATWNGIEFDGNFVWPQLIIGATFTFESTAHSREEPSRRPADLHRYLSAHEYDFSELLRERERAEHDESEKRANGSESSSPADAEPHVDDR